MILGFLTEGDLAPLNLRVTGLESELAVEREKIVELKGEIADLRTRIKALNAYLYNVSGEIGQMKRERRQQ